MFIGHDHSLFGFEKSYIKVMGRMLVSKINAVGLTSIDSSFFSSFINKISYSTAGT